MAFKTNVFKWILYILAAMSFNKESVHTEEENVSIQLQILPNFNTGIYKQLIAWDIYVCDPGKRVTLHIETYLCCKHFDNSLSLLYVDGVAEWLWRWTANPMGSARVGSNPISVEDFFSFQIYKKTS